MKMICPHEHCGVNIKLPIENESEPMHYVDEGVHGVGEQISWGHCPNCEKLIVLLYSGKFSDSDPFEAPYFAKSRYTIIEPINSYKKLYDPRIPNSYRKDFNESSSVLSLSPKASAAITRRMLQHILREHYKISKKDLYQEIEEFLRLEGLPSHISESVDAIRNVGNFAAHPIKFKNTGEIVDVEAGEAEWQLSVLEAILDFTFVQPAIVAEKKANLNAKLKDLGKPEIK